MKPKLTDTDIWSIVLSVAATLLCAAIDLLLRDDGQGTTSNETNDFSEGGYNHVR